MSERKDSTFNPIIWYFDRLYQEQVSFVQSRGMILIVTYNKIVGYLLSPKLLSKKKVVQASEAPTLNNFYLLVFIFYLKS